MTLPELCECSENQDTPMPESLQPNTTTTSTTNPTTTTTTTTTTSEDKLGKALLGVLHQAASQGRATCSLTGCVDLLSTRPDDVMLCVMPLMPQADTTATIQSTLIRAVCLEHSIRVVMVDCDVKLAKAVCTEQDNNKLLSQEEGKSGAGGALDENFNQVLKMKTPSPCTEDTSDSLPLLISDCHDLAPVMGFPCVLVEFPQDPSPEDELVAEFGKQQLYGENLTEPYIELPD